MIFVIDDEKKATQLHMHAKNVWNRVHILYSVYYTQHFLKGWCCQKYWKTFSFPTILAKVKKIRTIWDDHYGKAEDDYGDDDDDDDDDHKYKVQRLFREKCSVLTLKFSHSRRESNSPLNWLGDARQNEGDAKIDFLVHWKGGKWCKRGPTTINTLDIEGLLFGY